MEKGWFPRYAGADQARLRPVQERLALLRERGWSGQPVQLGTPSRNTCMGLGRVAWALLECGVRVEWGGHRCGPEGHQGEWVVERPCGLLGDVRSRREYEGSYTRRYSFFESQGHLPGALWVGNWTSLIRPDGTGFRALEEIDRRWSWLGLKRDQEVSFYCGTGWRSSLACWAAHLLGYSLVRNLDGGVFTWAGQGGRLQVGQA